MSHGDTPSRLHSCEAELRAFCPWVAGVLGTTYTGPLVWNDAATVLYVCCANGWHAVTFYGGDVTIQRTRDALGQLGALERNATMPPDFPTLRTFRSDAALVRALTPFWDRGHAGWIGLVIILAVILIPLFLAYYFSG